MEAVIFQSALGEQSSRRAHFQRRPVASNSNFAPTIRRGQVPYIGTTSGSASNSMARVPLEDLRAERAPRKQTTGPSRRSSRWSQRAPGKKDKPPGVQGVNHLRDVIRRAFKGCDRRSTDVM